MFHVPNKYRLRTHPILGSDDNSGNNGAFTIIQWDGSDRQLWIIASDEGGWEHVSIHVSRNKQLRTPNWNEMCFIKNLFWDEEDVVIQYHPKKSEYVNNHPNTLHLWRQIGVEFPTPPMNYVGTK